MQVQEVAYLELEQFCSGILDLVYLSKAFFSKLEVLNNSVALNHLSYLRHLSFH